MNLLELLSHMKNKIGVIKNKELYSSFEVWFVSVELFDQDLERAV